MNLGNFVLSHFGWKDKEHEDQFQTYLCCAVDFIGVNVRLSLVALLKGTTLWIQAF